MPTAGGFAYKRKEENQVLRLTTTRVNCFWFKQACRLFYFYYGVIQKCCILSLLSHLCI